MGFEDMITRFIIESLDDFFSVPLRWILIDKL